MNKKILKVEYSKLFKEWSLYRSENGWQYSQVISGTKKDVETVKKSFIKIGYTLIK